MIRGLFLVLALALSLPAQAQMKTERGTGAILRALDKVSGEVRDLELAIGQQAKVGRMVVSLADCRFPPDNIQGEAYGWLVVHEGDRDVFSGWMIASSPALNGMDHQRYDVWVLRCNKS